MRWLLFLSRLAFISGVCFLLSLSILLWNWTSEQHIIATVATIGYFLGMLLVPVTLLCYLAVVILRKKLTDSIPLWLVISNIVFLFVLLLYIIINNGQNNHSA